MYVTTRIQERMGVWSVCGSIHDYIPIPGGIVSLEGGNFLPGSQFCRYSLSSLRTINITHIHYIVLGHCGPEPCFLEARNSARASFASVRLESGSQVFSS